VVSLLGIVVNLAAIPLVLLSALPLGEAAVLAQALHLTPLAEAFLLLGQWPLWLGWQAVCLGASLPGSAFIAPIPTWPQIVLYYVALILLFAPRRSFWTWGGAGLAGAALLATVAWPLLTRPQVLEITCLDSYDGLRGVVVSPEGQRLAFSAPGRSWPGQRVSAVGPLPAYCHWRQWRRLDQVLAFSLAAHNAGELLDLAQQFAVGGYWYGDRGRPGPALWDLWNYLGDGGRLPLPLQPWRRGPPPPVALGSAGLEYLKLGPDKGWALQVTWERRRALILPPGREVEIPPGAGVSGTGPDLLVLPAELAASPERLTPLLARLSPQNLVIYGRASRHPQLSIQPGAPYCCTRDGAVSAYLGPAGLSLRPWGR
jgi:hypothetical protein